MGFSEEWEKRYLSNTHLSIWPWSDIVSLVNRHCKKIIADGSAKVLELGCGAGANIPFLCSLGFSYYAIEGSPTIVQNLHNKFPELRDNIVVGDFTSTKPYGSNFDLVIDRASVTHNNIFSIENALQSVHRCLKQGALFIGVDWFSTKHSGFRDGDPGGDHYTRTNFLDGQFAETGNVHFSDEKHMCDMFKQFDIKLLEEKVVYQYSPKQDHIFASWNIVAHKI